MPTKKSIIGWALHPEGRRDARRRGPTVVVSLGGSSYVSSNWSLGGVLLSDCYGRWTPGMEVEGSLRLASSFESHGFTGAVVRKELAAGHLALRFTELSDGAFALLDSASLEAEHRV